MKRIVFLILFGINIYFNIDAQEFKIRGVLPWHNFLSGPTAWNEIDYEKYLDYCKQKGINFIAFHNYMGGGERYLNYVEPLIKIRYKNILPEAGLDHSGTARWGYLPLKVKDYPYGLDTLYSLPKGAEYFGADCAITAKNNADRYIKAQELMKKVLTMAHQRGMQMALGFEFGVAPLEYASIRTHNDMYWIGHGSLVYNPFDPDATGILYATIDNILETYKGIDWIYLWLNEHCMYGVDHKTALKNPLMAEFFNTYSKNYGDENTDESIRFLGVWSQAYIQKAYNYIKKKASNTKIVIGGWGGEKQMVMLLDGLNKTLPKDIAFSMLNPNQGETAHPDFFKEIAKDRDIWAIPWLEGDVSLWHLQSRVNDMKDHVKKAYNDSLDGVIAIHWRTGEIKENFEVFTHFSQNPKSNKSTLELYKEYYLKNYGEYASQYLSPVLADYDIKGKLKGIRSPVYFAYEPTWGILTKEQATTINEIIELIDKCLANEKDLFRDNLNWLKANYRFALLFNEVSQNMQPAWDLRNRAFKSIKEPIFSKDEIIEAKNALDHVPVEEMLKVFASKVQTRGELGELSSIIQRVYQEYLLLSGFIEKRWQEL